jgi:hypothetical protein
VSLLQSFVRRDDADGRLPVLLDLPVVRCAGQAARRRLLRVLQLWNHALPPEAGR